VYGQKYWTRSAPPATGIRDSDVRGKSRWQVQSSLRDFSIFVLASRHSASLRAGLTTIAPPALPVGKRCSLLTRRARHPPLVGHEHQFRDPQYERRQQEKGPALTNSSMGYPQSQIRTRGRLAWSSAMAACNSLMSDCRSSSGRRVSAMSASGDVQIGPPTGDRPNSAARCANANAELHCLAIRY